ncbi:hypothetical protein HIM_12495 [Hirsutella minnesotensis 3608]|uniref:Uncharacterized protein n=1 Tax=Hirsutella minnesotensis 3608 TaxID=1043627 RepID=A0A0F7ZW02_9HYPO|nr:hypothetical protein HIM_12495 [Hirsutella minnesotensis 3608]
MANSSTTAALGPAPSPRPSPPAATTPPPQPDPQSPSNGSIKSSSSPDCSLNPASPDNLRGNNDAASNDLRQRSSSPDGSFNSSSPRSGSPDNSTVSSRYALGESSEGRYYAHGALTHARYFPDLWRPTNRSA